MFQELAKQSPTPLKGFKTDSKQFTNKKLAPMMASFFMIQNHRSHICVITKTDSPDN